MPPGFSSRAASPASVRSWRWRELAQTAPQLLMLHRVGIDI
jgi:hypothetical protein